MRAMLLRAGGLAAITGGALRTVEPLLRSSLGGQQLQFVYFVIDVFLLLGLIAWYGWRAEKLGIAGMIGFVSGVAAILVIRSASLFAPQGYAIGAGLLLVGLVVMNAPALVRRDRPLSPPLLWLVAFLCALTSFAYAPLAAAAGTLFGMGYAMAGVALMRA